MSYRLGANQAIPENSMAVTGTLATLNAADERGSGSKTAVKMPNMRFVRNKSLYVPPEQINTMGQAK